jgi:hypothetical protein
VSVAVTDPPAATVAAAPGDGASRATRTTDPAGLLWVSRLVLLVSVVLWIASLHRISHASVDQYGLLFASGPGLIVATLGVAASFALAVRADSVADCVVSILVFIGVTRATASIVVDLPIYSWTYKHIGVIDHLSTTGHLARDVDIYNNWPGFFSLAAWFSDITGVSTYDVARWFPVVADAAIVLGMITLSRAFGHSLRVALVAGFGMQVFNWVAQDYYSPQATAFVLSLAALALLLRSNEHPRAAWFTVPLFVAITITHQLTPFWLCGIAILFGLTKRIRPRAIVVVYVLIALAFAAANFKALTPYGLLTGFDPLSNAQSNVPTAGNAGRSFTSLAAKGTSGLMWLSAIACAWRARRRKEQVWVPAVLAFTSFALLAGQSYGGEAIFRVFLYSIPGCLLLIAPVAERALTADHRGLRFPTFALARRTAIVAVAVLAVLGSMQAYYGTWFINVVQRDGLVAEQQLLQTAPTNSLLVPLALGLAERPDGRYAEFAAVDHAFDNALVLTPGVLQSKFEPAEVTKLTEAFLGQHRPVYLIISEADRRYSDYYGLFPTGAIDRLVHSLATSPQWTTLQNTSTLSVFRLVRS